MNKHKFLEMHQKELAARRMPGQYDTTYKSSYFDMPTYENSPVYLDHRERKKREDPNYAAPYNYDLSPYPSRTYDPTALGRYQPFDKPYINSNRAIRRQEQGYDDEPEPISTRYERNPPRKTEYREPQTYRNRYDDDPAPNRSHYQTEPPPRRNEFQDADDDDYETSPRRLEAEFRDQLANSEEGQGQDLKLIFCDQCFKSKVCVNKLACTHKYCDDCTARLDGSDNPDGQKSFEWNFRCNLCHKFCAGRRVVRLDPFGRRLYFG